MIRRGGGIYHRVSWEDVVSSRSPRRVMMIVSRLLGKLG
jgi:hypothetical protein